MRFWSRLRATASLWWQMMRMQRVTREGWFYIGFTLVVGAAAINTGNNLLYLVLGLQVSLLLLSAFLSEAVLGGIHLERELPKNGVVGQGIRVAIALRNRKRRLASYSLVISEIGQEDARVYVPRVGPGEKLVTFWTAPAARRGKLALEGLRISTRFPFGLFEKSREQLLPGSIPIQPAGLQTPESRRLLPVTSGHRSEPYPGHGFEFHALREHRGGDDLRQVHWRSTAKAGKLLVVEKERERRCRITLLVDTRGAASPEALDGAADLVVALSRRLLAEGSEVGIAFPGGALAPGGGPGQLGLLADRAAALAPADRADPGPVAFPGSEAIVVPLSPSPPAPPEQEGEAAPGWSLSGKGRLDLRRTQRWSLLAAVFVAFGALALSEELPPWVILLFGVGAFFGMVLNERPSLGLRRTTSLVVAAILLALGMGVLAGVVDVIVAAPSFAAILAGSRLLSRRGPVDDPLLLLAALMMLTGGAALTGDLAYGLFFSAFAVVGTVALATTHLRREMETVAGPAASHRRGTVNGALLWFLCGISLTVLVGSLVVFLAFPRISTGVLSRMPVGKVGGGGERIELGGVGVLKDDPTPVLRVRFPAGRPPGEMYWRTTVFDAWDGRGWTRGPRKREPVAGGGGTFVLRGGRPSKGFEADIELLREVRALPVPAHLETLRFPMRRGVPSLRLVSLGDATFEVEDSPKSLRYHVRAGFEGEPESDPGSGITSWLAIPGDLDPRIRSLAQSFPPGDPETLARSMEVWLQRENRYTRELPGAVPDPLAHFLFERRAGHCEYFATSLALLLRLRGIPARVVAGYYGVSWVEAGAYWTVREGDAHAWTEAWIPGKGWIRLDATPADERPGVAEGAWAGLVEWVDVLRMRWANWVLDYDARSQIRLAKELTGGFGGKRGGVPGGRVSFVDVLRVLGAVLAGAASILVVRYVIRKDRQQHAPRSADHRRAIALYEVVRRRLRQGGIELGQGATSTEWSEAAVRQLPPEAAGAARRALRAYEESRFGGRPLGRREAGRLRRRLR